MSPCAHAVAAMKNATIPMFSPCCHACLMSLLLCCRLTAPEMGWRGNIHTLCPPSAWYPTLGSVELATPLRGRARLTRATSGALPGLRAEGSRVSSQLRRRVCEVFLPQAQPLTTEFSGASASERPLQ